MKKALHVSPVLRSIGVISAVAVLVGGVTFAALQSRATLTDNTISSASAGLLVDGNADGTFSEEEPGFAFKGIVPGVTPSEAKPFALQNDGETNLRIKAAVRYNAPENAEARRMNGDDRHRRGDNDPTMPELPKGVNASDIVFTFTREGEEPVKLTWKQLSSRHGKTVITSLAAGQTANLTVQVSIDESVRVSSVDIGSFDIIFTGKAIAAPETPEEPGDDTTVPEEMPAEETPVPAQ